MFALLICASVRCCVPGERKKESQSEREEEGRGRERELLHQRHQQEISFRSLKGKMSILDEKSIYYYGLVCV